MEPEEVPFELLEEITKGFCEDRKLGAGAFGTVYRGVTKNGEDVAVKMLHDGNPDLDDKQFQNEFRNLTMLKHQNIVNVLGYCYETKQISLEFNGKTVLAEERHRALCFQYLRNGSLENHLSDEFHGFDWHTRYKIIKGTSEGLKYLHEGSKRPTYHLDLKPDNILLDNDFIPKIADFGLSMIFSKGQTLNTLGRLGTLGYQPPEHIEKGEISNKFDIFSFGVVMLKILSGPEGYSKCADMLNDEFIDLVQKNWKDRLQATWSGSMLEAYCKQVKICTEIALKCVVDDSQKRPDIAKIVDKLNETESDIGKSLLLQVEPLLLQFPKVPEHSMTSCSLQLTNKTENHVVFRLVAKDPDYFLDPLYGVVHSGETRTLTVRRGHNLVEALANGAVYFTLESIIATDQEMSNAIFDDLDSYNRFFAKAKDNGSIIHQVKLMVVSVPPAIGKATAKLQQRRYSKNYSGVTHDCELPDQMQHSNLMTSEKSNRQEFVGTPETSADIGEKLIVGRVEEREKVIGLLLKCLTEKISILPIYGIGGMGKTTFAKLIYNDFKDIPHVWIYVSKTFDLNKIGNSIISQLSEEKNQFTEMHDIHSCLTDLLSDKKILIVLDDLWEDNKFQLEDLKAMLSLGAKNNTAVLVTTRSKHVAEKICTNHEPYKLEALTDDQCWDIIRQRSCFESRHDKEHLTGLGKEISIKCRGLALAAQSLGFILQSMTSDQWMEVRDNDLWNGPIEEDASSTEYVLPSLKLSYDSMTPSLRSCFTYCAIFPKGHRICKYDLIYQWISLGFINPTKLLSTTQLCQKYIMQLLGLSFLEQSSTVKELAH